MTHRAATLLVVPFFDEAARVDEARFVALLDAEPDVGLVLVDDGSRDATLERLQAVVRLRPGRVQVVARAQNGGKAEAVRDGLRAALGAGADVVGYFDADFATPPDEIRRLLAVFRGCPARVLLGSRVRLLGRTIQRHAPRHYIGRVFATAASLILGIPVYDTQCGAKLFRRDPALEAAVAEPFHSRWAFDVELLGRLLYAPPGTPSLAVGDIVEEPLLTWVDVPGSKLRLAHMAAVVPELTTIALDLARRRRR